MQSYYKIKRRAKFLLILQRKKRRFFLERTVFVRKRTLITKRLFKVKAAFKNKTALQDKTGQKDNRINFLNIWNICQTTP